MGAPKKPDDQRLDRVCSVRFTTPEFEFLHRVSRRHGMSVSTFVRAVCMQGAGRPVTPWLDLRGEVSA